MKWFDNFNKGLQIAVLSREYYLFDEKKKDSMGKLFFLTQSDHPVRSQFWITLIKWNIWSFFLFIDYCSVKVQKLDCGFVGMNEKQCIKKNCCWEPVLEHGVPYCFHQGNS